jgi:glutamate dehydrogenase
MESSEYSAKSRKRNDKLVKIDPVVIKEALDKLGYSEEMFELLKEPLRLLTVRIPVRI